MCLGKAFGCDYLCKKVDWKQNDQKLIMFLRNRMSKKPKLIH